MALLRGSETKQLKQLVKACLLENTQLKMELKKCQQASSENLDENNINNEIGTESQIKLKELDEELKKKEEEITSLHNVIQEHETEITELKKVNSSSDENNTPDLSEELKKKEEEITSLHNVIQEHKAEITKLQKIKDNFDAVTAKPKRDLTSFQSQIYQLLPDREDTLENLYNHITSIGFSELTHDNFEYLLRNLQRKDYYRARNQNNEVLWKRLDK